MAAGFCSHCGKPLPSGATACAACGATVAPGGGAGTSPGSPPLAAGGWVRNCVQCRVPMRSMGTVNLRSTFWGTVSDPILGSTQQPVDRFHPFSLYYCGACGRFDLFYPGT